MGIVLLWATWAHEYMAVFVKKKKMTDIARRGDLTELDVCDFDKLGQHVNEMKAVAVKKFRILMVTFSYNQTKR